MPIAGTLVEYEEHLSSEFIGSTLSELNDDFVLQLATQRSTTQALCPYIDRIEGLTAQAATFPNVTISAGSVTSPSGVVYTYSASTIAPPAGPYSEYRVYLDNTYQVGFGTSVPTTARFQLGVIKHNEFGTGFALVQAGPLKEISFIDPISEQLLRVELYSGSVQLMGVDYVYDSVGTLTQSITQTRYKTTYRNYLYDINDVLEEITEYSPVEHPLFLNGSFLLDNTHLLAESTSLELILPPYELNYDNETIYNGSQTYGEF